VLQADGGLPLHTETETRAEHPAWEEEALLSSRQKSRIDKITVSNLNCINGLVVAGLVMASVTYSAMLQPPAWFQAQVKPPNWSTAGGYAAQSWPQQVTASPTVPIDTPWSGFTEELKAVMEATECSARTREKPARAFFGFSTVSFCLSVVCISLSVLLLSKGRWAQAESRQRCLLWATLCLLLAVIAQTGALAVTVLYAGSTVGYVHGSTFTTHWGWFAMALLGVVMLSTTFPFIFQFMRDFQPPMPTWQLDTEQTPAVSSTDEVRTTPSWN
jgi:hypothetical protein